MTADPNYLWLFQVFATASSIASTGTDIVSGDGADTDLAPHYALVDIAPGWGTFVNDSGQAVYTGTNGSYYFWDSGTSTHIAAPSGLSVGIPVGLNNAGQVAGTLMTFPTDDPAHPGGNLTDKGMALWDSGSGGEWTLKPPVPNLLSYGQTIGSVTIGTNSSTFLDRQDTAVALNDSGAMIGSATEICDGPYPQATVAINNGAWYDNEIIIDLHHELPLPYDPPTCVQGGKAATLLGINNSGTVIGTYSTYISTNASPGGPSGTIPDGLERSPLAINDNGVIAGAFGYTWFPDGPGSYSHKFNGPGSYINNNLEAANAWYHGRARSLPDLVSAPGWTLPTTGTAISHDSGIIIGTATQIIDDSGDPIPSGSQVAHAAELIPADWAPPVVRVNSNFDEQKVDATTGYAKPDCADEDLTIASGHPNAGKITVNDLSPHFFGIKPGTLPASWYSGATVTIKILAPTDTDDGTGLPEPGQVRLYATHDLGQSGEASYVIPTTVGSATPINLVSYLYASSPSIPSGARVQYWMEGTVPGPITMEFRVHNACGGNIPDIVYTQHFLVATQQSKADWQKDIRQEILLQSTYAGSAVDMNSYTGAAISAPFMTDKAYIQTTYAYYQELFTQKSTLFSWAGLAKMAGADVYGAMDDAEYGRTVAPSWIPGATAIAGSTADFIQDTMIKGNYEIFDDLAWQFRAYHASGIWALRYTSSKGLDTPSIRPMDLDPWEKIYQGDYSSTPSLVTTATSNILQREQQFIAQRSWDLFHTSSIPDIVFSTLTASPLPSGASFVTVMTSSKDVTVFTDRWDWINDPTQGMWQQWNGYSNAAQVGFAGINLRIYSEGYSLFYSDISSTTYPIIW